MMKEHLITLTQIIKSRFSVDGLQKPVFWAFAVAGIPDIALKAMTWKPIALVDPEIKLLLRFAPDREGESH